MIELGLVEDNYILRNNYEEFFNNEPQFKLVFSVSEVKTLQSLSFTLQPQIILLDLLLPSGNSMTYIHKIKQFFPSSSVIVLSSVIDERISQAVIQNGADGYLLKTSSLQYIKDALLKISEGGIPLSPLIVNHLLYSKNRQTFASVYPNLTKREIELVDLLKTGMSNKMAALSLNVTFFTVNQHLKNIYTKLQINSKNELIALAMKFEV